jgi:predicted aldo/keto reductase-like oxidoreductase
MRYRKLGNTCIKLSELGLGVEHLKDMPSDYIRDIVDFSSNNGVNYFDLVWSLPNVVEGIAQGIEGRTDNLLAIHLGSCHEGGKYKRSRDIALCRRTYEEVKSQFNSDNIFIINLHYLSDLRQWEKYSKEKELMGLALELRNYGDLISVSTHDVSVVREAANHPQIDNIMFQINIANHNLKGRDEALLKCQNKGVSLVAMKPYAGGKLLNFNRKTKIARWRTGGVTLEAKIPGTLTTHKCLKYALDQPGVKCVVSGVQNIEEMKDNLDYFNQRNIDYTRELELIHD